MRKFLSLFCLALALVVAPLGCSSGSTGSSATPTTLASDGIMSYATPAAETMMKSFQQKSLEDYVKYADPQFRAAVTQSMFDAIAGQMQAQYGNFVSLQFLSTEEVQGYTRVHYKAEFEKGEIGLMMVFNADHSVAGQFFE